jgi:hypothetical protein
MNSVTLWAILFLIVYALKKDKKHEKAACSKHKYLDDEWEDFVPEGGQPERSWSIELLSSKNNPVVQKLEAFSLN